MNRYYVVAVLKEKKFTDTQNDLPHEKWKVKLCIEERMMMMRIMAILEKRKWEGKMNRFINNDDARSCTVYI